MVRIIHGRLNFGCTNRSSGKASALDLDDIPVYGEKPEGWKPSGRRVKRGLYCSAAGVEVNADCNGAWNIARKAKVTGTCSAPARGVLTSPKRLRIWDLPSPSLSEVPKESPRLQTGSSQ
ncbi:MAG: hypothetical protein AAF327_07915 [Cyanobacteria bacterium P01_A01_bin.37]